MFLALDVGNSTITYGIFKDKKLIKTGRVVRPADLPLSSFTDVDQVLVSSVVPKLDDELRLLINQQLKQDPSFVTHREVGLKIALNQKEEIGVDRLVNALAAYKLYGAPLIIVDFGTATTFCALSKEGGYEGGAIAPGIGLTRESLHAKTAKLPLIEIKPTDKAIGKSTVEAMEAGIYLGYVGLINELIVRFKKELGEAKVVATGGFAKLLSKAVNFDIIDLDLTLKGLQIIAKDWGQK